MPQSGQGGQLLSDGPALYTPGLSENRGGTSAYYSNDRLGNLWTLDGSSKSLVAYEDTSGFGGMTASGGSNASPFKFGGGNGCQTDGDTGLVLMGHRYYDTRIGRFLSQDPAGNGNNWYAYAGNNPTNNIDPTGIVIAGGGWSGFVPDPSQAGIPYDPQNDNTDDYLNGDDGTYNEYINGKYQGTKTVDSAWKSMDTSGGGMGPGMFASESSSMRQMRLPKPLVRILLGALLGGFGTVTPGVGGPNEAPVPQTTSPQVEADQSDKKKKAGSSFSLPKPSFAKLKQNLVGFERMSVQFLDEWGGAVRGHSSSGGGFTFSGAASGALE